MICKFCNAELPEDVTLCPACGNENVEETVEEVVETMEAAEETMEETAQLCEEETAEEIMEETAEESAEEPAEEPKRKTKLWVKIVAVVCAVALLVVLAGAVYFGVKAGAKSADSYTVSDEKAIKEKHTVVATVGDLELTNSALQIYFWQAANDFYNTYGSYVDSSVLDFSKPLDEQFYDEANGVTWQKFFLENGLNVWSRYAALAMQAKEEGYELDAEKQAYMDSIPEQLDEMAATYGYATTDDMLHEDMGVACDTEGYMDYIYINFFASQYLDSVYESMIPTMEEIEAYYKENEEALTSQGIVNDGTITTDVRHILITPKGGTTDENGVTTYSETEWEQCRQEAQELLDQWKQESGTEDGFAQFAMSYTEDPGSMSTGGLYTDIYEGQMVEPFEDWCFDASRQYGDTGLVQTTYGYHIMFFVGSEEVWVANVSDSIIYERSMDFVNGAVAKWPMEVNNKKIILSQVTPATAE